jgi:hypothetical protein
VDDFRGPDDFAEIAAPPADTLDAANLDFWRTKLDREGLQAVLPQEVAHLFDMFRACRSDLLMLADHGQIHPGPTIYDSFWIRDSSIEGIACALAGDLGLARVQFGQYYPTVFNQGSEPIGPATSHGFFGGEHEKNDREWDSNGQALWAFGRFDRIEGRQAAFGAKVFAPYVIDGARWIRDNRSAFGLLHSGWSAEHLGDKANPHFWDDLWALAGLYEAARLGERQGVAEVAELWAIFDELKASTADSIRWVLRAQREAGYWETFIPTGPGDVGRLDSTLVGALCYFHPCKLHIGLKLGADIDLAFRLTLETIWSHFVRGGFRHDAAWHAFGPYLTLQLAHAFLLIGDLQRMDACLGWSVGNAAFARMRRDGSNDQAWQIAQGAWNEQHAYPVATDMAERPDRWWYMGDIPHGWAAAEFILLVRDMLFFEAAEEDDPHIYLAPGILPRWLMSPPIQTVGVSGAPTCFGQPLDFSLRHHIAERRLEIRIDQAPAGVRFLYPCRLGPVSRVVADGVELGWADQDVGLPAGTRTATITYL